jgi:hypothetical protein
MTKWRTPTVGLGVGLVVALAIGSLGAPWQGYVAGGLTAVWLVLMVVRRTHRPSAVLGDRDGSAD